MQSSGCVSSLWCKHYKQYVLYIHHKSSNIRSHVKGDFLCGAKCGFINKSTDGMLYNLVTYYRMHDINGWSLIIYQKDFTRNVRYVEW